MKTIEQIALEVRASIRPRNGYDKDYCVDFAKAFLAAVDSERGEPVAWTVSGLITDFSRDFSAYQTKTYTRPLYLHPQPTPQEVEDARRYRALAANLSSTEFCEHLWTSCNDVPTKEQLDAAIDAAIAKEES